MTTNNFSGYCLLNSPSDQVQPLTVLTSVNHTEAEIKGFNLTDLFVKSSEGLPVINRNGNLSATINKSVSVDLSVDGNLTLLQELLTFLKLSASFKLQKNKTLRLHMIEPKIDTVNEFQLDGYINNAEVSTISPTFSEALQNNQIYVVSSIIKCRKYSLEYLNSNSTDSGVQATVPMAGELSAGVHTSNSDNDIISSEGDNYITIGVKAYQILCVDDNYLGTRSYRIRRDEKIKSIKGDEDFPGNTLQVEKVNVSKS